ncbi:hypothetical protein [Rhizobium leguminosarum]|uniref:hypothetical protein n=1 Tax=Rhizobium leguminosarum TaxID=384 RepID=UPI00055D3ECE|nr:hypothetical protein [Rhizobium leguminosarum]
MATGLTIERAGTIIGLNLRHLFELHYSAKRTTAFLCPFTAMTGITRQTAHTTLDKLRTDLGATPLGRKNLMFVQPPVSRMHPLCGLLPTRLARKVGNAVVFAMGETPTG